jgi:FlaA1/EpsC-like NDP-sugar epimerase
MEAENVIAAAIKCDVKNFVALSTDKACAPINLNWSHKVYLR